MTVFLAMVGQALVAAAPAPATPGTQMASHEMLIHLHDDRLTVKLQRVPLENALKEIRRRAAIEIAIAGPLTETISMEFREVPLEEGLRRLLRGHGWMMLHAGPASQGHNQTLRKIVVVDSGRGGPHAQQESSSQPWERETSTGAVAALLDKEEVKAHLDVYLRRSSATAKWEALQSLLDTVDIGDFRFLIEMLQDENIQPTAWEMALAPLSALIGSGEQRWLLSALQDPTARESMVKTLESYLMQKMGAKAP